MNARSRSAGSGFTLIEMVITLCVFVLLAAMVFGIFSATLESAAALQDDQKRQDETAALDAWLRHSLLALPASGVLVSYRHAVRPGSGIIWGAGDDLRALDLEAQANGQYTLRYTTCPALDGPFDSAASSANPSTLARFQAEVLNDDPVLAWRPIVRDLKSVAWRFRAQNQTGWQDIFPSGKPVLAELTFQPAGVSAAIVDDFWIPPTQLPAGQSFAAPGSVTANP